LEDFDDVISISYVGSIYSPCQVSCAVVPIKGLGLNGLSFPFQLQNHWPWSLVTLIRD